MITSFFPKCPSIFNLQQRKNSEGRFYFFNPRTQESWTGHSDFFLAKVLVKVNYLFIFLILRIPYRILSLISGDFVFAGYQIAERNFRLQRQIWSINLIEHKKNTCLPNFFAFYWIIASAHQLALNILKIGFYPLAIVGIFFGALYGNFVKREDGRFIISNIENFFSRSELVVDDTSPNRIQATYRNINLGDFALACMQTRQEQAKRNFYAFFKNDRYDRLSCNSLNFAIQRLVKSELMFYTNEGFGNLPQEMEGYRKKYKTMFKLYDTENNASNLALEILNCLKKLKVSREKVVIALKKDENIDKATRELHQLTSQIQQKLTAFRTMVNGNNLIG